MPRAAWCTTCHASSPSEEQCPRCQGAPAMLNVHPEAERTGQRAWEQLKAWQRKQARVQGTDGFMVIPNKALASLAAVQPETTPDLVAVPGIGPKKARDYGAVLLKYFRGLHAGEPDVEPLVARAPMPEGFTEEEQAWVLELREAAKPLSALAQDHGLSLDKFLERVATLVEKGAVDLPHIYCAPSEVAWLMPRYQANPADPLADVPEASPVARVLLPALARFRAAAPSEDEPPKRRR